MRRFNLYITAQELKESLVVRRFFGEQSFRPNANILPGQSIPVILLDSEGNEYLHTMKWGIDLFGNGARLLHNARSESILNNAHWAPLINSGQRCIVVVKGFYIWNDQTVYNAQSHIVKRDRQPMYIEPPQMHKPYFYLAALYEKKRVYSGIRYSVTILTEPASTDLKMYAQRMPKILYKGDSGVKNWLNKKHPIGDCLKHSVHVRIQTPIKKIGKWVDSPSENTAESVVLQSREQWDLDLEAKKLGFDSDFDFDKMEREALRINEMNKNKKCNMTDNYNNSGHNLEKNQEFNDRMEVVNEEDKELKEEEYSFSDTNDGNNTNKKRQRNNSKENDESPPQKRRKTFETVKHLLENKTPERRRSVNDERSKTLTPNRGNNNGSPSVQRRKTVSPANTKVSRRRSSNTSH